MNCKIINNFLYLMLLLRLLKNEKRSESTNFSHRVEQVNSTIHSNIIQEEPLPRVKTIFARICNKEHYQQLSQHDNNIRQQRRHVRCHQINTVDPTNCTFLDWSVRAHCHKQGCEMSNFYQIVGFQEWWEEKNWSTAGGNNPRRELETGEIIGVERHREQRRSWP